MNLTSGQPFVRLEAVSKSYGSGSSKLEVLDEVDLDLPQGETTSLVGRSGTGKSTLLSLIAGLMRPDTGHVYIGGQQMDQLDDDGRAGLRAERIGFVLQSDNLIPFLTAVENVELAIGFAAGRRSTARARELLSELGLGHRMDHLPRQLSGGESQRVAVAVALANEPDLLLADEVVGQLDSTTAADVMEMIFTASRERNLTVLYVTHDEQLARQAHRTAPCRSQGRSGVSIDASITVDSVVVEHQTSSGPVRALDGVSFRVDSGSSVAITGPSGGGKSTLLGVIGGLARPTSGTVRIGDSQISELSESDRSDFRRSHIGFVYQADNLLPSLLCWRTWGFS